MSAATPEGGSPTGGSLRFRLLVGTWFWIAASILVAGWGLGTLFQQHVAAQLHAELQTHLDQLTAQLELDGQGRPTLALPLSDPRFNQPFSGLYWQVVGRSDAGAPSTGTGLRSRSLWDEVLALPAETRDPGVVRHYRIAGPQRIALAAVERDVTLGERPFRLVVAADEQLMIEPVARFRGQLWLALGVLGLGLAIAALVQVFVGLAPLRRLHRALSRVREGRALVMEGRFPSELAPLVTEFNSVLAQNADVVARARTQAGDLAHALKTPLSVLALTAGTSGNRDSELARLVIAQVEVARKQVDYHLARAQAAATARIPGARTPLQPVVDGLVRTMRRIHAERDLEWDIGPIPASPAFRGGEQDLQEMLGNLVDNACKWARSRITIRVHDEDGRLSIAVEDDGKGVAAEQREAILRRGVRADEQVPGSGLGLAIADDVARMHGGNLTLGDSPLGGLRAVLTLPATP